jgi:NAD(P)-dependent dehydrogenase (short-subunit alcohol dehydrogenase family)
MGKVALVTGGSSGIGAAIATTLAANGWTVYAAARRVERMEPLPAHGVIPIAMDVTDDATMVAGVRRVIREQGRIDALVNNAGYGSYGSVEHVPLDEARRQLEVNVFGMARLIQLVTPHMRSRGTGRSVTISSVGGKIYEPLGAWYHATRFAAEGLSDSLRIELRPFGIDVVIIEPGPILSEWNTIARESLLERSRGTVYERRARAMARQFERTDSPRLSSGPEVVAEKVLHAVTTVGPAARYPAGRGARAIMVARCLLPDRAMDLAIRAIYREGRPER